MVVEERRIALSVRGPIFAALLSVPILLAGCGSEDTESSKNNSKASGDKGADDDDDDDEKAPSGKADAGKKDAGRTATPDKESDAGAPVQAKALGVPCAVAKVLETHCTSCHGDPTNWGAPMAIVDHDDFHKNGVTTKSKGVDQLVQARINDTAKPMPPKTAPPMGAKDLKTLDDWLTAGAPAGEGDDSCIAKTPDPKAAPDDDRPVHPDAVCYELRNHGKPVSGDKSKYGVRTGEHYAEFFFNAPWKEPSVMVSFKTLHDQTKVLHHWLMYKSRGTQADGAIGEGIGSHVGGQVELLAGWAVGGNEIKLPEGIAASIPPPGGKLMVEWHYYNPEAALVEDQSGVEVCVVPASKIEPSKVASLTWVGNENLGATSLAGVIGVGGMPPGKESKVQDICTPRFTGLPAGEPVRIFEFVPHMHQLGRHMRTWVARKDGTVQKIFDEAFEFSHQISYAVRPMIELFPGDRLVNECTFFNDTKGAVGFGPSSDQEMCYQFTYAYPAGSLVNGVSSLTGATNTCWDNKPAEAATLIGKSTN